jgi:5'-3' exonuclease
VNGIGPVSALKLLQKHEKIENIPDINKEVLQYPLIRTLFNPSYPLDHLDLVQNVPAQIEVLNELVVGRLDLNVSILFDLASLA